MGILSLSFIAFMFSNSKLNKMYEFVKLLESGHYYLDGSYSILGIETPIKIAVDGNDFDVETSTFIGSTRLILVGGNAYLLNNNELTISLVTETDEAFLGLSDMVIDYSKYKKIGQGESKLPQSEDNSYYPYYEYEDLDNGSVIRYYFKDNELYCIYVKDQFVDHMIIINELTKEIPTDRLRLPEDYMEI